MVGGRLTPGTWKAAAAVAVVMAPVAAGCGAPPALTDREAGDAANATLRAQVRTAAPLDVPGDCRAGALAPDTTEAALLATVDKLTHARGPGAVAELDRQADDHVTVTVRPAPLTAAERRIATAILTPAAVAAAERRRRLVAVDVREEDGRPVAKLRAPRPSAGGYQQRQSRIAVGTGGRTGRADADPSRTSRDFAPEEHTDCVLTVSEPRDPGARAGRRGSAPSRPR